MMEIIKVSDVSKDDWAVLGPGYYEFEDRENWRFLGRTLREAEELYAQEGKVCTALWNAEKEAI